jgi:hypothetical protein
MNNDTLSPLGNVITIDDERIKSPHRRAGSSGRDRPLYPFRAVPQCPLPHVARRTKIARRKIFSDERGRRKAAKSATFTAGSGYIRGIPAHAAGSARY